MTGEVVIINTLIFSSEYPFFLSMTDSSSNVRNPLLSLSASLKNCSYCAILEFNQDPVFVSITFDKINASVKVELALYRNIQTRQPTHLKIDLLRLACMIGLYYVVVVKANA